MFTDRVQEQELLSEILQPTPESARRRGQFLTVFYGVGGVGKTTLCRRAHEIAAELASNEVVLVTADFDNNEWSEQTTFATVAGELVRKFAEKGIQPRLSGALLALYSQNNQDLSVTAGWAMALETLDKGVELAGIPGLGLALKGFHLWRDRTQRVALEKQVRKLGLWPEELYGRVNKLDLESKIGRALFEDVRGWLTQNPTRHLRLLIDGFERLQSQERRVDAQKHVQDFLGYFAASTDRAACGRFRALLFGREKLMWDELYQDDDWNQCWNQHLLAGLAEADSRVFLGRYRNWFQAHGQQALADALQTYEEQILDATDECTNGERMFYPFYLNLAVEMLERSVPRGEKPDLGRTPVELQDRFFRYLDPAELRVLMILGLAEVFDEDLFDWLTRERLIDFPVHSFHTAVRREHSYFQAVEQSPGSWRFHRLFEQALHARWLASEAIKAEGELLVRRLLDYLSELLTKIPERDWTEREVELWHRGMEIIVTQGPEGSLLVREKWTELLKTKPWNTDHYLCTRWSIDFIRRILKKCERAWGEDDVLTQVTIDDLASRLYFIGDWIEAQEQYQRALEVKERTLGSEHPSTLSSLNDLGHLLDQKGDIEEAGTMLRRAMETRELLLGPDHPDTLMSMNYLGSWLMNKGDLQEAEKFYRRALENRERVLGVAHADTLKSYNNMGNLFFTKGDIDGAERNLRRALDGKNQEMGVGHPSTFISMHNLANVLRKKNDHEGAEKFYRLVLESCERTLAARHPVKLMCSFNLGILLMEKGIHTEAETLLRHSFEGRMLVLGSEHLETLNSMGALASVMEELGRYNEAEALLRRLLQERESVLGQTHPHTLESARLLGSLLNEKGDNEAAAGHLRQWIKISADEGIRYDLACYECLLGHLDDARRLLRLEFAESPSSVEDAMTDDDLAALRSELPFLAKNISP